MNNRLLALSLTIGLATGVNAATLSGQGATLPGLAYTGGSAATTTIKPNTTVKSIFGAHAKASNNTIVYGQTGSGAGKTALNNNTGAFAASDSPLSQTNYTAFLSSTAATSGNRVAPVQVPAIAGAVAIVFNNPDIATGVTPNLTSQQIAKIFSGNITNWSQLGYPSRAITVVARGSGSGTTFSFINHLNAVGGLPTGKFFSVKELFSDAVATAKTATFSFTPATSNGDVVTKVNATAGAIGYAEAANASAARFVTVNGFHPINDFNSPYTIAAGNILTDYAITGVVTSGTQAGRATFAPITGVPSTAKGFVKLVRPDSYAKPTVGYPIMAVSYLLAYRSGYTGSTVSPIYIRNLLKVTSDTTYRTTTATDPKYVTTVVGKGYAWLDGINSSFLNLIN